MTSAHFPTQPCNKYFFLIHFQQIPRNYREHHRNSCKKAGIPANSFSTREGRSAGVMSHRGSHRGGTTSRRAPTPCPLSQQLLRRRSTPLQELPRACRRVRTFQTALPDGTRVQMRKSARACTLTTIQAPAQTGTDTNADAVIDTRC